MRSLTKSLLQLNLAILSFLAAFNLSAALIIVEPSENSYRDIQEALIIAEPGDVIRLTEVLLLLKMDYLWMFRVSKLKEKDGCFHLEFSNQKSGAQGLLVTSDNVTLQDFAVVNAKGDAIKSKGANNISFIRVKTEWTGGPKTTNWCLRFISC